MIYLFAHRSLIIHVLFRITIISRIIIENNVESVTDFGFFESRDTRSSPLHPDHVLFSQLSPRKLQEATRSSLTSSPQQLPSAKTTFLRQAAQNSAWALE